MPFYHVNGKGGCYKCSPNYKPSTLEWINKVVDIHNNKYDYSKVDYITSTKPVIITCRIHGDFKQTPVTHQSGSGCQKCAIIKNSENLCYSNEEWISKAKLIHGDKFDYSNVHYEKHSIKVQIICKLHGIFDQTPANHLIGQGCPLCSSFKTESLCRDILKELTGETFIKVRPDFLQRLELDGYCEELNMAFEYNGRQHYEYTPHFHRNGIEDFYKQQANDIIKFQLCHMLGIKLIIIPCEYDYRNVDKLREYIVSKIK